MAKRSGHLCRWQGCIRIVRNVPYCDEHARIMQQRMDAQRGTAAQRGYNARWRRLRLMFLAENPLCSDPYHVHCGTPALATDVDHIMPRERGGDDDWINLQALCHSCHSRKTAAENGGVGGDKSLGAPDARPHG